ncbi:MAG: hypothetical protein IKO61_11790 [Lachnospiraceae bacterium]|nr:hypothetical protein [Lachnospiraceae bacterium]
MKSKTGYLAGRRLNGIIGAMCYISAITSGVVFSVVPGELYVHGAGRAWFVIGLLFSLSLSWLFIPVKLNDYCIKTGTVSLPLFLSKRYKEKKHTVRRLAAVIIIGVTLLTTVWIVSDCAKSLVILSGEKLSYQPAVFIVVVILMAYVVPFGFKGVNSVGVFGFALMMCILVAVPVLIVIAMGGHGFVAGISSSRPGCTVSDFLNIAKSGTESIEVGSLISRLTQGLAFFALPILILYYTTYRNEKKLLLSRRLSVSLLLVMVVAACVIGVMGRAYLAPKVYISGENPGMIIYREIADKLSADGLLPFVVKLLVYAGLPVAYITTADKCVYLTAMTISDEINDDNGKGKKRLTQMVLSFIILVVAAIAAVGLEEKIRGWSEISLEFMAVTLAPVIITALYSKHMNKQGVVVGVLLGAAVLVAWKTVGLDAKLGVNCMPAGFLMNLLASVVTARLTGGPGEEVEKEFEDVKYGLID